MSASDRDTLKIFAGTASRDLAIKTCAHLALPVGEGQTLRFPDGETLVKVDEDVRGRDCYVMLSTCEPVNDNLMELLVWIDCLRRASAKRITAVMPYFGYARQDRKDEGRVPITAKLVANLITQAGADRVLCLDLHAAQIQGFFDIPVDHMSAAPVLADYFLSRRSTLGDIVVVSPDVGNVKVANMYANVLQCDLAIIDKRRPRPNESKVMNIIGNVAGKTCVMIDDMVDTAGTLCIAAQALKDEGAVRVVAYITHPILSGSAVEKISKSALDQLVVTDTIPLSPAARQCPQIRQLSVAGLLGETIRRIRDEESVSSLYVD